MLQLKEELEKERSKSEQATGGDGGPPAGPSSTAGAGNQGPPAEPGGTASQSAA
jgi:hypothetical protein